MDQDFHYYGTYYAARIGGDLPVEEASLIAKAANFIDFLSETAYAGYWKLIEETEKNEANEYTVVGTVDYPRYTFQAGLASSGTAPEDGLWCSYHFTPGNFADPEGTPTPTQVHGADVVAALPKAEKKGAHHTIREVRRESAAHAKLLNRPMSPLSRTLLADTIACLRTPRRLESILRLATGHEKLLAGDAESKKAVLKRFGHILLGVRAHVIADTWAHQDFSGLSDEANTYLDVNSSSFGRQSIDYTDVDGGKWNNTVLTSLNKFWGGNANLEAVPNGTSYLGHGWMGHFPDYSFAKYRYRPFWRDPKAAPLVRNNPEQYGYAFIELCSLFARSHGKVFRPTVAKKKLEAADRAIRVAKALSNPANCPREWSAAAWISEMAKEGVSAPLEKDLIDTKQEPDTKAVLPGMVHAGSSLGSRYGEFFVSVDSDLYLFQIAADYHFHTVRHYLAQRNIRTFSGSWSVELGPLGEGIEQFLESGVLHAEQTNKKRKRRGNKSPEQLITEGPTHPRAPQLQLGPLINVDQQDKREKRKKRVEELAQEDDGPIFGNLFE